MMSFRYFFRRRGTVSDVDYGIVLKFNLFHRLTPKNRGMSRSLFLQPIVQPGFLAPGSRDNVHAVTPAFGMGMMSRTRNPIFP